jgi:16S rRNA (cytosine1402-N4)-methyltransferase
MTASAYHAPVMVREVLAALEPERGGRYLDGTAGGGGHVEAILEAAPGAEVVAVDRDPDAIEEARRRLAPFGDRVTLVGANFAEAVDRAGIEPGTLAGALLDLGVSSYQIDTAARGFTFRSQAPLDMRMEGPGAEAEHAADILATRSEDELARIFRRYGEEPRARRLARTIVERREEQPLETSDDLVSAIEAVLGPRMTQQDRARIFQALRIAVNREIESLEAALPKLRDALQPGGVLVVISYHSLEDRLVKLAFREWSADCVCPPGLPVCQCRGEALGTTLTRKPQRPREDEVEVNPRARSARLRAWRKR